MTHHDENTATDRSAGPVLIAGGVTTLVNESGRIDLGPLVRLAKSCPETDFVRWIHHPVLAGLALQAGSLEERRNRVGNVNQTLVFAFDSAGPHESTTPEALRRAIYPLVKRPGALGVPSVLSVGRLSGNDLVIPDVSISKRHALIEIGSSGWSIRDCGSTNGTLVNSTPIGTKPFPLKDCDIIAFARYEFFFLMPESLYERLVATTSSLLG